MSSAFGSKPLRKSGRGCGRVIDGRDRSAACDGGLGHGAAERAEAARHHNRLAFHRHAAISVGTFAGCNCRSAFSRAFAASAALAALTRP